MSVELISIEVIIAGFVALLALALTLKNAWDWRGGKYLCEGCIYNNEADCKKAIRPRAIECTAFRKEEVR